MKRWKMRSPRPAVERHIAYDEAANQRENEDVEESDGEFKVYGINYVPGSLIYHRMGEKKVDIILYVTWDKGRKPISKAEKLDFEFDSTLPKVPVRIARVWER